MNDLSDFATHMSLRDWFAGQALPTVINAANTISTDVYNTVGNLKQAIAKDAYLMADAMLEERKKSLDNQA